MLAEVRYPHSLSSCELDNYLALGWFRMGQTIFTTNFLTFNEQYYSAIWLRVTLDEFVPDKKQRQLRKLNAPFRIEIQKANVTPAHETLFTNYRQSVDFSGSASLHDLLYGTEKHDIYNTYEINIYDGEKLIAAGFFDMGRTSAAGITAIYDPAYKKHSLGKYLIFLKMEYCKGQNLQYFYPGYFVPGYQAFDYKLSIGTPTLQYLQLSTNHWVPIHSFSPSSNPFFCMHQKLEVMQQLLSHNGTSSSLLNYLFFEANMIPRFSIYNLFDFPVFLHCLTPIAGVNNPIIIYDVRDSQYHLIRCINVADVDAQHNDPATFSSHLLKVDKHLFSTAIPEEMALMFSGKVKRVIET